MALDQIVSPAPRVLRVPAISGQARPVEQEPVSTPVKILAVLHIALATAGLVAGGSLCASFWMIPGRFSNTILAFAIPIFLFFALFLLIPELAGGVGLLIGKRWGRIVIFFVSGLMLLVVPIGTIFGGFGIWALLGDRPPGQHSSGGNTAVRRRRPITGIYLVVTLLILAAAGAAGIILMQLVFRFQEQDTPPAIQDLFPAATILLPGALVLAAVVAAGAHLRGKRTRTDQKLAS